VSTPIVFLSADRDIACQLETIRHGGEEFAVILPECTAENARKVMDGIREHFAA